LRFVKTADNENELYRKILYEEVKYPQYMSNELNEFLLKILVKDPKKRLTFSQVCTPITIKILNEKWMEL